MQIYLNTALASAKVTKYCEFYEYFLFYWVNNNLLGNGIKLFC
jgi:hypothetical protein